MAIKVGGTSVISDSRVLENVTGLKTINSTSILGSGNISAGASTTEGAVGTYSLLRRPSYYTVPKFPGTTDSASNLRYSDSNNGSTNSAGGTPSGTWKMMAYLVDYTTSSTLYIRIS